MAFAKRTIEMISFKRFQTKGFPSFNTFLNFVGSFSIESESYSLQILIKLPFTFLAGLYNFPYTIIDSDRSADV